MRPAVVVLILALASTAPAQTASQIVTQSLAARNAAVCNSFDLPLTCFDSEVQAAW